MLTGESVLYVGRFNPFHNGHLRAVQYLSERYEHVIIGIGSAQESRTPKNPFTGGERFRMIRAALKAVSLERVDVIPIPDIHNNSLWVSWVKSLTPNFHVVVGNNPLVGLLFEQAGYSAVYTPDFNRESMSSTEVRKLMAHGPVFHPTDPAKTLKWENMVPDGTVEFLKAIDAEHMMRRIMDEKERYAITS